MGLRDILEQNKVKSVTAMAIKHALDHAASHVDASMGYEEMESKLDDAARKLTAFHHGVGDSEELTPEQLDERRHLEDSEYGLKKLIAQKKYNQPSLLTQGESEAANNAMTGDTPPIDWEGRMAPPDGGAMPTSPDGAAPPAPEGGIPAPAAETQSEEPSAGGVAGAAPAQAQLQPAGTGTAMPDSSASSGGEVGAQKLAMIKEGSYIRFDYSSGVYIEGVIERRLAQNILLMKNVDIRTPLGTEHFSRYIMIVGSPVRTTGATGLISESTNDQPGWGHPPRSQKARVK